MNTNEFSVYQFFENGLNERVAQFVDLLEAVAVFSRYTLSVGAIAGTTTRVIVTDGGDSICLEWQHGKGITFPPEE